MKVKCIANDGFKGSITLNKIYEVINQTKDLYVIIDDVGIEMSFAKWRFEPIPDQPKWMPLTRGGYEYHIYEEFDGKIWGRVFHNEMWGNCVWRSNGGVIANFHFGLFDLIPYEDTKLKLQQEIEDLEKQLKEKKRLLNN